jgi:hypothetical protein
MNSKLQVYDMNPLFFILNGEYKDIKGLKNKIDEILTIELYEDFKMWYDSITNRQTIIGKCRYCHSYNDETMWPNLIVMGCQTSKCMGRYYFKMLNSLRINEDEGTIWSYCSDKIEIVGYHKFIEITQDGSDD